jgi:hypothetical protein
LRTADRRVAVDHAGPKVEVLKMLGIEDVLDGSEELVLGEPVPTCSLVSPSSLPARIGQLRHWTTKAILDASSEICDPKAARVAEDWSEAVAEDLDDVANLYEDAVRLRSWVLSIVSA